MKKNKLDIKIRLPEEGLYLVFLKRINSCAKRDNEIIRFPVLFSRLCTSFQLSKKDIWALLYFFQDMGFINIICGHGVKLNYGLLKNG